MVRTVHHQELEEIRTRALALHTRLVDEARDEYREKHHRSPNPVELLQALTTDEDFQWLQPLTRLICSLDVTLEQAELTDDDVLAARAQVDELASGRALELNPLAVQN